ncbi:MAG: hypothetical protein ACYCXW_07305 [Solirubrobacteraceae bacterium]
MTEHAEQQRKRPQQRLRHDQQSPLADAIGEPRSFPLICMTVNCR